MKKSYFHCCLEAIEQYLNSPRTYQDWSKLYGRLCIANIKGLSKISSEYPEFKDGVLR